jgi:hypothetical protein
VNRIHIRIPIAELPKATDDKVHRYYFADETVIEFNQDVRCLTCAHWEAWPQSHGRCHGIVTTSLGLSTHQDFACANWTPKETE